jgi:hypothetical protein
MMVVASFDPAAALAALALGGLVLAGVLSRIPTRRAPAHTEACIECGVDPPVAAGRCFTCRGKSMQ